MNIFMLFKIFNIKHYFEFRKFNTHIMNSNIKSISGREKLNIVAPGKDNHAANSQRKLIKNLIF